MLEYMSANTDIALRDALSTLLCQFSYLIALPRTTRSVSDADVMYKVNGCT